ncbi:hypothetical protein [Kitasatospora herbaricolor]|uniref:Uncharacterized protein n=1 Tax=Kitasatospora herbaricolor TaxID=68217 RepID=A0ABZ1W0L8_9ACTN|nr:hypothetical protein [Kitasatospora herbaricolor]
MTTPATTGPGTRFAPGTTVMRRDIHLGQVWSAQPCRALSDTGTVLHLAYWPGIHSLAPTTWATALRTGDAGARMTGLTNLAAGTWELGPWTWQHTALRSRFEDLIVDLVVEPDLSSATWKDEDEHGRRLGFITDTDHHLVEQARWRALGLLQDRARTRRPRCVGNAGKSSASTWTTCPPHRRARQASRCCALPRAARAALGRGLVGRCADLPTAGRGPTLTDGDGRRRDPPGRCTCPPTNRSEGVSESMGSCLPGPATQGGIVLG